MNQKRDKVSSYLEGERVPHFRSLSEIEYKEVYGPSDWRRELPEPGEYPFTRGIHKDMYRGRLWTRRQQSGFGTPEESNERFKYLLGAAKPGSIWTRTSEPNWGWIPIILWPRRMWVYREPLCAHTKT
ncbi:MAG: hypothetical protein GWN86_27180 [Desulfobacterales bacterium]|nr:hypothetical protein [Desulfobacterales bacterium]